MSGSVQFVSSKTTRSCADAVLLLGEAGFEVKDFVAVEKAVAFLETRASAVALVFTDIHTPGRLDGVALAEIASERWPWIKILITSATVSEVEDRIPRARPSSASPGARSRSWPCRDGAPRIDAARISRRQPLLDFSLEESATGQSRHSLVSSPFPAKPAKDVRTWRGDRDRPSCRLWMRSCTK
jgi:hypothetical protein